MAPAPARPNPELPWPDSVPLVVDLLLHQSVEAAGAEATGGGGGGCELEVLPTGVGRRVRGCTGGAAPLFEGVRVGPSAVALCLGGLPWLRS